MTYDDETIKKALKAIDEDETVDVESDEANFIEQIVYNQTRPLTAAQAKWALKIIERYER